MKKNMKNKLHLGRETIKKNLDSPDTLKAVIGASGGGDRTCMSTPNSLCYPSQV